MDNKARILYKVPSLQKVCILKITADFLRFKYIVKDLPNSLKMELSTIACRRERLLEDLVLLDSLLNCQTTYLSLKNCLANDRMLCAVRICKQLTLLNIGTAPGITTRTLCNIFPYIKELEQFSAEGCTAVTDEVILSLACHCAKLAVLDVPDCSLIGDKSLISITNKSLIALNMSGSKITDQGVSQMVFGKAKNNLREITLDDCYISAKSVDFIIRLCPKLSIFSFRSYRFDSVVHQYTKPHMKCYSRYWKDGKLQITAVMTY